MVAQWQGHPPCNAPAILLRCRFVSWTSLPCLKVAQVSVLKQWTLFSRPKCWTCSSRLEGARGQLRPRSMLGGRIGVMVIIVVVLQCDFLPVLRSAARPPCHCVIMQHLLASLPPCAWLCVGLVRQTGDGGGLVPLAPGLRLLAQWCRHQYTAVI
jgi:hypothetical protein